LGGYRRLLKYGISIWGRDGKGGGRLLKCRYGEDIGGSYILLLEGHENIIPCNAGI
jgi:hypothetical protein